MKEYIQYEEPTLEPSACHVGQACFRAVIETLEDLSPIMPYVNAVAKTVSYDAEGSVLIFRRGKYKIAMRSNTLAIATVSDLAEGREAIRTTVADLNDMWENRQNITPKYHAHKRAQAFDIYRFLPKTNCKACGEASCLAFAAKLVLAELDVDLCTPLNDTKDGKAKILNLTS